MNAKSWSRPGMEPHVVVPLVEGPGAFAWRSPPLPAYRHAPGHATLHAGRPFARLSGHDDGACSPPLPTATLFGGRVPAVACHRSLDDVCERPACGWWAEPEVSGVACAVAGTMTRRAISRRGRRRLPGSGPDSARATASSTEEAPVYSLVSMLHSPCLGIPNDGHARLVEPRRGDHAQDRDGAGPGVPNRRGCSPGGASFSCCSPAFR